MDFTKISESIVNGILTFGPKVLAALLVFFIGNFVINKVAAVTGKALKRKPINIKWVCFEFDYSVT